jgi:hypothetical protein
MVTRAASAASSCSLRSSGRRGRNRAVAADLAETGKPAPVIAATAAAGAKVGKLQRNPRCRPTPATTSTGRSAASAVKRATGPKSVAKRHTMRLQQWPISRSSRRTMGQRQVS